jgi:hypothetical protein
MKRREFFAASAAAGLGMSLSAMEKASGQGVYGKQLIELRLYHFANQEKLAAFDKALGASIIPAMNRIGISPVGVFKMLKADNSSLEEDSNDLYILIPHKSAESVATMIARLEETLYLDWESEAVFNGPKSDPAFIRFESSLLLGFDQAPKVEVPTKEDTRLMQLRIYESHNTERALKKIEMFNTGGEIAIFRECGMNPVFFGQALIGDRMPNLTYMLSFDNEEAQKAAWDKFRDHPDWKRISGDPQYADSVSNITNLILRPTKASQI